MRRRNKFAPFICYDRSGYLRLYRVAAEQTDDTVRLICFETTKDHVFHLELGEQQIGEFPCRFAKLDIDYAFRANELKLKGLERGATPEAIRLLGLVVALTKQEEATMAEKLKGGKAAKTDELKEAAKAAPVGGKKAPVEATKRKGNPEALAKAREGAEAKKAELMKDKRKVVLTDKGKEKVKTGDQEKGAIKNLVAMRDGKTVGGAITAGLKMADLNYAEKAGTITIG